MSVRTTLTLDEDVAAKVNAEARRSGRAVRAVVNEALRAGLEAAGRSRARPAFKVRATAMGLRSGVSIDSISALIDEIEGPSHR